jgi:hypothetical protein
VATCRNAGRVNRSICLDRSGSSCRLPNVIGLAHARERAPPMPLFWSSHPRPQRTPSMPTLPRAHGCSTRCSTRSPHRPSSCFPISLGLAHAREAALRSSNPMFGHCIRSRGGRRRGPLHRGRMARRLSLCRPKRGTKAGCSRSCLRTWFEARFNVDAAPRPSPEVRCRRNRDRPGVCLVHWRTGRRDSR